MPNRVYHVLKGGKLTTGGDLSGKTLDLQRHNQRLFVKQYEGSSKDLMFMWMDEDTGREYTISLSGDDVELVVAQIQKFFYAIEFEGETAQKAE